MPYLSRIYTKTRDQGETVFKRRRRVETVWFKIAMHTCKLLTAALLALPIAVAGRNLSADEYTLTAEAKDHWAWKPPVRPAIPRVRHASWVRNPIDAFILAKLESAGLSPAAPADREQLLRRVTFDLTGLPPTPEEIDAFLAESSAKPQAASAQAALAKVVDRLLASPHYGERWGRHWLDLARFAESNGYEHDELRPNAWRYRDYVIRAFNADKPYDRFVREQIAGDELTPDDPDALLATGFNLLGPDMTDSANQAQRRQNTLNDMTDTTGLVFLGLTVGCARCHDHKFEPIPQKDYYRLQAFFAPALRAEEFRRNKQFALLQEKAAALPKTFVLRRGELTHPAEQVTPGWPIILRPDHRPVPASIKARPASSGRRSALAKWLTDPHNPLTARVLVNRLWQHHFGRGIVPTTSDFGLRGQPPTHPELLDWLATEFVRQGWSIKQMHRLMLLSNTYQQSTRPSAQTRQHDPDNQLFSRMNRVRLEGEAIRDALLAASGRLDRRLGGPSVFPPLPAGIERVKGWKVSADPRDHYRRSVYVFARRNLRFAFLEAFDLPDSNLSCPKRERSTTATQALTLLNSAEVHEAAKALAVRVERAAATPAERVTLAYRLALGRRPTAAELRIASAFLAESPLAELCRALFNVNEFVYLD